MGFKYILPGNSPLYSIDENNGIEELDTNFATNKSERGIEMMF